MLKLKDCPFCGSNAEIVKDPLWGDNGHGYQECYDFYVQCRNPRCKVRPKTNAYDNIYNKNEEEIVNKVINIWNDRIES